MAIVIAVVSNTPAWVFLLLGYLVWQGIVALQSNTVPVWRMMIVPAAFIMMGLLRAAGGWNDGAWPLLGWLTGAIALLPLGLLTGPRLLAVDHQAATVIRRGSAVPLIRNLTVFLLQYAAAVVPAFIPGSHVAASIVARAVSGASAGYFVGWALAFWRKYSVLLAEASSSKQSFFKKKDQKTFAS